MSVKITFDKNAVKARIEAASKKAIENLSVQVLSDCNEFCPKASGTLIDSSSINSDFKRGLLVWSTPYARYLYYGLLMVDKETQSPYAKKGHKKIVTNKSLEYHKVRKTDSNSPQKLWCEKARETYNKKWEECYQNALRKWLK